MRSILISKPPKQVTNILNGEQTMIIFKTAPKEWLDYLSEKTNTKPVPMTGYVYCKKRGMKIIRDSLFGKLKPLNGKVVAKFTLKKVEEIKYIDGWGNYVTNGLSESSIRKLSCLCASQLDDYLMCEKGYAYYISDLQTFDKPKNIWEFEHVGGYASVKDCPKKERGSCNMGYGINRYIGCDRARLKCAPHSWCYVEELR